jgi:hypothetical protein
MSQFRGKNERHGQVLERHMHCIYSMSRLKGLWLAFMRGTGARKGRCLLRFLITYFRVMFLTFLFESRDM